MSAPLGPGPGSATVLIGNKPAFRALVDMHSCQMVVAATNVPHMMGPVLSGSATVLVEGYPLVRMGDTVMEAGAAGEPPNIILEGCTTVLVG